MAEKTEKKAKAPEAKKDAKTEAKTDQKAESKDTKTDAKTPEKSQAKVRLKGKNWYTIISPALFGSREIGETLAREDPEVIGRKVDTGVSEVTGDPSKYYMKAIFEVDRVEAGKAYTKLSELEILKDFISRMVQRRVRRIDSIDTAKTKDGVTVTVKTVGISIRRINNSMKSSIRSEMKNVVQQFVSENTFDNLITAVIANKLQMLVRKNATKAYPLRAVEVRRLQVVEYPEAQEKKAVTQTA